MLWRNIRDALGRSHPTDLLMDINLICPLCNEAALDREAVAQRELNQPPEANKCAFCAAYHQAGGCREVCAEISTRVAERDWDAARAVADDFIARLEAIELPAES